MKGSQGVRVFGYAVFTAFSVFTSTTIKAVIPATPAAPVKLAWNASGGTNTTGYAIYYGVKQSAMTNRVDAGANLQGMVANLQAGTNYVFYVVAYNSAGVESTPSNVIQYNPTVVTPVQMSQAADGTVNIQFRGPANASCTVQYTESFNPPNWQTLTHATAAADGTVIINDPPTDPTGARFYRASVP